MRLHDFLRHEHALGGIQPRVGKLVDQIRELFVAQVRTQIVALFAALTEQQCRAVEVSAGPSANAEQQRAKQGEQSKSPSGPDLHGAPAISAIRSGNCKADAAAARSAARFELPEPSAKRRSP